MRRAPILPALLLLAACATSGGSTPAASPAQTALSGAVRLMQLAVERDRIAAAVRAAHDARELEESAVPRLVQAGLAAGVALDAARLALQTHTATLDSPRTATAFAVALDAAEVAMATLRALARDAGVEWEAP